MPQVQPRCTGGDISPGAVWVIILFLMFGAPPLIGWAAGKYIGGGVGIVVGAGLPVVGWGGYILYAFAGPSDYGMNQTLGPILVLIVCPIVGFIGGSTANKQSRWRNAKAAGDSTRDQSGNAT